MVLHVFSQSPYIGNDIQSLLGYLSNNDSVLLTQDAVYLLNNTQQLNQLADTVSAVFVLEPDVKARGLRLNENSSFAVDYPRWVELSLEHHSVVNW